ncbi:MAG: hypothetical protein K5867_01520 [Bacteroidales bacterium]|jgi:YegS/Rv2252/BmrU family lipid kinase|nr:hypothetical protein [Bacteroidales bacterium]
MKKKILVIVNPISGVGRQKRMEKLLKDNINHDLIEYDVRYTEYIHHGTEIAREGCQKDYDAIVAVGGDGSVNDVVSGMFGSGKILGIIPCGSGNGLARNMKLSLIPAFAVRNLNYWHEMTIDTIRLNEQYTIASIAGVGFDAFIARLMKAAKTRGFPAYLNLILREYPTYECKDYKLTFDGREMERNAWFITFANSNQFGYNAAIAPQAKLNDGLIDVSIVDKIPIEHVPITGPLVYANHFELSQHVEMFKAREIVVKGNVDHWVNIDGEGINVGPELNFVNHQASLRVIGQHTVADLHEYNLAQIKKTIKL